MSTSVLHVRDKSRDDVISALDNILRSAGFTRKKPQTVPAKGPYGRLKGKVPKSDGPRYLVSPLAGHWLTVIEAHNALDSEAVPQLPDLGKRMSGALSCFCLTLFVYDDDLCLYNLDRNGKSLDRYNSCPQYFEKKKLTAARVKPLRHKPKALQPLLPSGCALEEMQELLDRGWWRGFDAGTLDKHGIAPAEEDDFVFEGDRMTAVGTMLQLHGGGGEYPYTAWGEDDRIAWQDFLDLRYIEGK